MSLLATPLTPVPAEPAAEPYAAPVAAVPPPDLRFPVLPAPPAPRKERPVEPMGFVESARMDREMAREFSSSARAEKPSPLRTLLTMSTGRFVALVTGAALLAVGLLALRFPVFLSAFDQWGFQLNCGNGFHGSFAQATAAGPGFAEQCQSAVATRRSWATPLAATGALLLGALAVLPPRQGPSVM